MKKKIQRILIWIFELSLFCGYFYILFVNLVCGLGYGGISSRGQAIKNLNSFIYLGCGTSGIDLVSAP